MNINVSTGISLKEKIGFGLGDAASNLVFQVMVNFMLIYYTDVFGMSAAAAGTLMLVIRVLDAITDPIMGGIADRTNTRWGKYRPYLIIMCIPYSLIATLAFFTPDISTSQKLLYAYVTYGLLSIAYTAINIPYSALGGVLTEDVKERSSIQSIRFVCAAMAGLLVTGFMLKLVEIFGQGDQQRGFTLAMASFGILAILCFVICFLTTRERYHPPVSKQKTSFLRDLISLLSNDQFRILIFITLFLLIVVAMRGAVAPYYVRYVLGVPEMTGQFMGLGMAASILGALITGFLTRKYCKLTVFKVAAYASMLLQLLLFVLPANQLFLIFAAFGFASFFHMILVPILFSMVPDATDYGQLSSGKSTMGMSFAVHLLAIKLGLAIGAAVTGWLLAYTGYEANVNQQESAMNGIKLCFALLPSIFSIGIILAFSRYRLGEVEMNQLHNELEAAYPESSASA